MTAWQLRYQEYLQSEAWQGIRRQRLIFDAYRCHACGNQQDLEVHHLTYRHIGHERLEELITLCHSCHRTYHQPRAHEEKEREMTPPVDWYQYLQPISEFSPLIGQDQVFRVAAQTDEPVHLIVQPTGYGKTLSAIGLYAIFRARGLVDSLLIIVPTDTLRRGYLKDIHRTFAMLGVPHKKIIEAERTTATLRYHTSSEAEIFITTYQSLNPQRGNASEAPARPAREDPLVWFDQLMSTGRWMVIHDEAHHLSEENKWAKDAQTIARNARSRIYLSATPIRTDGRPLLNVPRITLPNGEEVYKASVEISVKEAVLEGAIRQPHGHIQHYWIDVELDGTQGITRIDTDFLKKEGVTDLNQYEARRGFRYDTKFLHRILLDSLACLSQKLDREPEQHQGMVFAMTCEHAESVAEVLNRIEPGICDWVGTLSEDKRHGRPDGENKEILDAFGENRLRILVQVDKAGEGFDNPRISVLVFLNLLKSLPKLQQQLGRGLRLNRQIRHDRICDIFTPSDTPIAEFVYKLEAETSAYDGSVHAPHKENGYKFYQIPDLSVIDTEYIRTDFVNHRVAPEGYQRRQDILEACRKAGSTERIDIIEKILAELSVAGGHRMEADFSNDTERKRYYSKRVEAAVKCYASNLLRWQSLSRDVQADEHGHIIKAVHKRWGDEKNLWQSSMMADEVKNKYEWVQGLNVAFGERREVPPWLQR